MPYWYWNGRITAEQTRRQMREMIAQGVFQAVVFPWDGIEPSYLSEPYWAQVSAALEAARELGFTLNFADELNWPSAHAWRPQGGPELSRVLELRPDFRMRRLDSDEHLVEGPRRWCVAPGTPAWFAVAGRVDDGARIEPESLHLLAPRGKRWCWEAPPGRWVVTFYRLVPATGAHNTRVDLLNPDAVRLYLDLVYEEFARRFPDHLGRTLKLTVADHEGAYGSPIAWTPRLFDEFQRRYGYDLRPRLPLLTRESRPPAVARKLRTDYLELLSDLYARAFTEQVAAWCRRHGLRHATSLYEEQLWIQVSQAGDMFRHWRAGDFVMIDALLERARMPLDFKEAVSVAHFENVPLVVENQGLQGHDSFLSPEKMRLGTNMALLWGANLLVPYFDYDPEKITWPPQWFRGQPFWRYFRRYADYVRRVQFMNAQGLHLAPVAIYYPLETAFAHSAPLFARQKRELYWGNFMDQVQNYYSALQLELARQGWDYHVLDRYYLARAQIVPGKLKLGEEEFRVLILPPMTEIDQAAAARLRAFIAAGGIVFALGTQPEALSGLRMSRFPVREHKPFMDRLDYVHPTRVPDGIRADLKPVLDALRAIEPPAIQVIEGEGVYFSRRRSEQAEWFWVVNDGPDERVARVRMPAAARWEKWDAETGARCSLGEGRELTLRFGPWDAFFLVRHAGTPAGPCAVNRETTLLQLPHTGWRLRLETDKVLVPYAAAEPGGEPVWLAPERLGIRGWWLIGPFPYGDHEGFFRRFPPERGFHRTGRYRGAYGPVQWNWIESPGYRIVPREVLGLPGDRSFGVYYGYVNVYSPIERRARLVAAFADSLRAWWNGKEVLSIHRHPKWLLLRDCWAETAAIQMRRGWNRLLVKLGPSLMVPTAFSVRLTDESGSTLRDLVFAREKRKPTGPIAGQPTRLRIEVPPGTVALEQDARRVPVPMGASTLTIEVDHIPEKPLAFLTAETQCTLASWSDSALRHYSGAAVYETEFELPQPALRRRLALDLGDVGVAAEVWLNGQPLGVRIWRPFRFDITGLVEPRNRLRVRVANSDAGWQAQGDTIYPRGSWGLDFSSERDRLLRLRPNGLEGPVRIIALE